MDINKKAYTRLWVHFGPRGKDLCERGEWTHLEDLTSSFGQNDRLQTRPGAGAARTH